MGLKAKSYRFDDEVRGQIAALRKIYGTDNAAMRFVFGLGGSVVEGMPAELKKKMGEAVFAAPEKSPKNVEQERTYAQVKSEVKPEQVKSESIINRLRRERGYGAK